MEGAMRDSGMPREEGKEALNAFLLPLLLDGYPEGDRSEEDLRREAAQAGLLGADGDGIWYVAAVLRLTDGEGRIVSGPGAVRAAEGPAGGPFRRTGFCSRGKVVMLLMGGPADFDAHLHALAEGWVWTARQRQALRCCVGLSRRTDRLEQLHRAYREAVEAMRAVPPERGGVRCFTDLALDGGGPRRRGGKWLCRQVLTAIEQNYGDPGLSLASLSSRLHVSPNHLSACVRRYAGEGFLTLLIRRRMEAARELLESTVLQVSEVAGQCGYTNQHYFSSCFKRYYGVSPNALRRRRGREG